MQDEKPAFSTDSKIVIYLGTPVRKKTSRISEDKLKQGVMCDEIGHNGREE